MEIYDKCRRKAEKRTIVDNMHINLYNKGATAIVITQSGPVTPKLVISPKV